MNDEKKQSTEKKYTEFSLVTVNEIAKILNVQKQWAYDLLAEYVVLGVWCGSRRKYELRDVMKAVEAKRKKDNEVLLELLETTQKRKAV